MILVGVCFDWWLWFAFALDFVWVLFIMIWLLLFGFNFDYLVRLFVGLLI